MISIFTVLCFKPVCIAIWSILNLHPVHVSVTNIEIDTETRKIEYSVRIFADDFAYAIEHLYEKSVRFDDGISEMERETVTGYINSLFKIIINGSKCSPECQKIETADNSLWIHFDIQMTEIEITSLKVVNRLLLDLFVDQTNLTIITMNGKQMGYTFNYLNQEAEIDVN